MDTSGPGNVLFGYYTIAVPEAFPLLVGHIAQLYTDERLDFPDDQDQIRLGRRTADAEVPVTAGLVESLIWGEFTSGQ